MGFEVPVFVLIGISIVFYLGGFCSPAFTVGGFCSPVENLQSTIGTDTPVAGDTISQLLAIFSDPLFLALVGLATVSTFLLGGNFTITFLVPIFMIVVLINFFILPISFIFAIGYDPFLKILFGLLLNAFLILSIVEFSRH